MLEGAPPFLLGGGGQFPTTDLRLGGEWGASRSCTASVGCGAIHALRMLSEIEGGGSARRWQMTGMRQERKLISLREAVLQLRPDRLWSDGGGHQFLDWGS